MGRGATCWKNTQGYSGSVSCVSPVFQNSALTPNEKTLIGCELKGAELFLCPSLIPVGTALFAAWPQKLAGVQL